MAAAQEADEHRLLRQLAAVHGLASQDRAATEYDILVTTILDSLSAGPRPIKELSTAVEEAWPGAGITARKIDAALAVASELGLCSEVASAAGPVWDLSVVGTADAVAALTWAAQTIKRATADMAERAKVGIRHISSEEAHLWVLIVARALMAGLAGVTDPAPSRRGGQLIGPTRYDTDAILGVMRECCPRPDVREFLIAAVLAALDRSDPFGNELVSHVTTGYVLYAFMARRDFVKSRAEIGSLAGSKAVLDTPCVLPLLGGAAEIKALEQAVRAARIAGMIVQLPSHYLEELSKLLDRLEETVVPMYETEIKAGTRRESLREIVDDQILCLWLTRQDDDRYRSWAEFRKAADQLPGRLDGLGVDIVELEAPDEDITSCRDALRTEIASRHRGRGPRQIDRDAVTMAYVWQTRRQEPRAGDLWPAAWVVTWDSHMNPAFRAVVGSDASGLTLTPAHWLTIASLFVAPAPLEMLAQSAATLMAQEAVLSIAAKFPPEVALELSKTLAPEARISDTDWRVAQLDLSDVLASEPDYTDPKAASVRIAAALVAKRALRMSAGFDTETERREERVARLQTTLVEREAALGEAALVRQELAQRANDAEVELQTLRAQGRDRDLAVRRRIRVGIVVVLIFIAGAVMLAQRFFWLGGGTLFGGLALAALGSDWARKPEMHWTHLLLALVPEVISLGDLVRFLHG